MLPPLISMAWAAWETGAGIGARPGMAIEPGIAAMANTSATAMAIQDRVLLFPTRIMCKLELIQPEYNPANRRRGAARASLRRAAGPFRCNYSGSSKGATIPTGDCTRAARDCPEIVVKCCILGR